MNKKNTLRITGSGQKHYLDFLRNLTPQILIFTFVILVGHKLNLTEFDLSNWRQTTVFYVLLISFFIAVYCNCSQLIQGCYADIGKWLIKLSKKAESTQRNGLRRLSFLLIAIIKKRLIPCIEFTILVFFFQVLLATAITSAVYSAYSILNMNP